MYLFTRGFPQAYVNLRFPWRSYGLYYDLAWERKGALPGEALGFCGSRRFLDVGVSGFKVFEGLEIGFIVK